MTDRAVGADSNIERSVSQKVCGTGTWLGGHYVSVRFVNVGTWNTLHPIFSLTALRTLVKS